MSIWDDAFESFLDAEYGQEPIDFLSDINSTDQRLQNFPTPKAIYVYMQFDDNSPSLGGKSDAKSPDKIKAKLDENERRLSAIERQYEALVAYFGEEAIEAAKRALRASRKRLGREEDGQDSL